MASGNSLIAIEPTDYHPPTSNAATPDRRNNHPVLDFDASVAESALFSCWMPRHYAGGGITLTILWAATVGTSGAVQWAVSFERHDPTTNLGTDSFGTVTVASNTNAPTSAAGLPATTIVNVPVGNMDGLTLGEHFRLKLTRNVAGSMPGDAELFGIDIVET